jgi:hypothetical protein
MLNTVGRFIYTKFQEILYDEHWEYLFTQNTGNTLCWALWEDLSAQNTGKYFMLNTVAIFIYTKYWGIHYVEHCGKIYWNEILGLL